MQPRLTRSATEKMVAGVCGGLAEYFNVDPVIVRLIMVLITLTSGLGVPVYLLLWLIMPRSAAFSSQAPSSLDDASNLFGQNQTYQGSRSEYEVLVGQRAGQAQSRTGLPYAPPADPEYRFDPLTGVPLDPQGPALGRTVNLGMPPADLPATLSNQRKHSWRTLGVILIGIGGLIFVEQLGIDMSLIFPMMLIVAGVILMRRRR